MGGCAGRLYARGVYKPRYAQSAQRIINPKRATYSQIIRVHEAKSWSEAEWTYHSGFVEPLKLTSTSPYVLQVAYKFQ